MGSKLVEVLYARAKAEPERQLFHYLQQDLTVYKSISLIELEETAKYISIYINKNIKIGERILLLFENTPSFIFSFFGAMISHAIPVCADPSRRNLSRHLSYYLSDMETQHIFTSADLRERICEFLSPETKINMHIFEDAVIKSKPYDEPKITTQQLEDICFIQYTSGSTGKPKGVVISHSNIIANSEQIKTAFNATKNSVGLSWLPHFHDMGLVGGIIQPLYSNFPVYIISHKLFAQQPYNWLRAIDKFRVTITGGPNIAYEFLRKQKNINEELDLSCWDVAFIGADFVSATTIREFASSMFKFKFRSSSLVPCYGMAEATLMVCSHKPGMNITIYPQNQFHDLEINANYYIREDAVSCGKVTRFTDIIIVRGDKICKENEPGEICISGRNVISKYWNQSLNFYFPQKSSQCLSSSYIKTGDVGVLVNGELYVIGRCKDLLIINGVNISPTDIERDIQEVSEYFLVGRGIVYQESHAAIGLVQEVEKKLERVDWRNLSRLIQLSIFKKHGLVLKMVEFVKRGALLTTSSGKIIRSQLTTIKSSSFIYREQLSTSKGRS